MNPFSLKWPLPFGDCSEIVILYFMSKYNGEAFADGTHLSGTFITLSPLLLVKLHREYPGKLLHSTMIFKTGSASYVNYKCVNIL